MNLNKENLKSFMKVLKIKFNLTMESRVKLAAILVLCILTGVVFINSIHNEFTNWDDLDLIVNNKQIRSLDIQNLKKIFNPMNGGTYQPIRVFSYAIDYSLGGLNPVVYHIHNILLHAFASVFLFLSFAKIIPNIRNMNGNEESEDWLKRYWFLISAFTVAVLFAVNTVNVEAVSWLSSRKYVLLSFFSFLSLYLYLKSTEGKKVVIWLNLLSVLSFILAVFSSPFGVVLPGLFFLYEYCRDTSLNPFVVLKRRFVPFSPYLIFGILFFILIWSKLVKMGGGASTSHFQGNFIYTIFTIFQVFFDYLRNFIAPYWLNNRYVDYVFLSFTDYYKVWTGALIILCALSVSIWSLIKNQRITLFCVGWFLLAWLPASNIIPISTKMADRYVYLASPGFFLFFSDYIVLSLYGYADMAVSDRQRKYLPIIMVSILLMIMAFYSVHSIKRNRVWKNSGTLWSDSLSKDYGNLLAHTNLGTWLYYQGEIGKAEKHYKIGHIIDPVRQLPLHNLGSVLVEQGKFEEAIAVYKKMLVNEPGSLESYKALSDIYIRMENLEEASLYFNRILDITPHDPLVLSWQGFILNRLERYREARDVIEKGIQIYPDSPELHFVYGEVLFNLGDLDKSKQEYEKTIELTPLNVQAYEGLGRVWFRIGDMEKAVSFYKKGLDVHSGNASIYNNLGNAYLNMGRFDDALYNYKKALEINPRFTEVKYNICMIKEKIGSSDKALDCYSILIEKDSHVEAMNNAGNILVGKGDIDKALDLFKRALDIKPDYVDALYNLGAIYLEKKEYGKALGYFERVLSQKNEDPGTLNSIGIIALATGDIKKAAEYLEKAASLVPDDPGIHFNLGIALVKKGDIKSALFHFKKTLKLDPKNNIAAEILNSITSQPVR